MDDVEEATHVIQECLHSNAHLDKVCRISPLICGADIFLHNFSQHGRLSWPRATDQSLSRSWRYAIACKEGRHLSLRQYNVP